jgi:hypothetical protein
MALEDIIAQLVRGQQGPPPPPPGSPGTPTGPPDPKSFTTPPMTNPVRQPRLAALTPAAQPQEDIEPPPLGFGQPEERPAADTAEKPAEGGEPPAEGGGEPPNEYPGLPYKEGYTPYKTAVADRKPGELGKESWAAEAAAGADFDEMRASPHMVGPEESYKVAYNAAEAIARHSAPSVAQPASIGAALLLPFAPILNMLSSGKFSRNYNAAQLRVMGNQRQQALANLEMARDRHGAILQAFDEVFWKVQNHTISNEEGRERVRALIIESGHSELGEILNQNDLGGVYRYLQTEDAHFRDLHGATRTMRKMVGPDEDKAIGERYGITGGGGGSGLPERRPGEGASGARAAPAPAAAPTAAEDVEGEISRVPNINPEIREIANSMVAGGGLPDDLKKGHGPNAVAARGAAEKAAGIINRGINGIINDRNPELSIDEKTKRIEQLNPTAGSTLRSLLEYRTDPRNMKIAGREHWLEMAHRLNPNYQERNYDLRKEFTRLPQARVVSRVGPFVTAGTGLYGSLLRIDENQVWATGTVEKIIAGTWTGDPTYVEAFTNITNVIAETQAILSGTGRPSITLSRDRAKQMLETMSPAQVRVQLAADVQAAYGMVRTIDREYKDQLGDPNAHTPFYSADTEKHYKAILRANPYTGEMPSDAPASIRAVGKQPGAAGKKPSWLVPDMEWKPLTEAQVTAGQKELQNPDNLNSPDPKVQARLQYLRRRLGIFADPGE